MHIFITGSRSKRPKFDDNTQCILRSHLECQYINTRFSRKKDALPPSQPNHFTPLVLSYENENNRRRTTTKELSEVFSILDQSDKKHIILVKGSAGIGKTELLKHIAYCWAGGEGCNLLLAKNNLVFLLCLKDREVQKINSLKKFVCYFYGYSDSNKIDFYEKKLEEEQGRSVVLLLDGYDEYPPKLLQKKEPTFISKILTRQVLPDCSIVISSRPHAPENLFITSEVEIVGFDEQGQDDFVKKYLAGEPSSTDTFNKYREANPAISSFCSIPFNMSVLVTMFKLDALPTSSTKLHNLFICKIIQRHTLRYQSRLEEEITDITDFKNLSEHYSKIIGQLSKLAFEALKEIKQIFSLRKIKKACPDIDTQNTDDLGFGLLKPVECYEAISQNPKFTFIFTSVQEFLAACYIINLPEKDEELAILNEIYHNDNYLNMVSFYIPLTKEKREALKNFVSSKKNENISNDNTRDYFKNLLLYKCFSESCDDEMCSIIEEKFSSDETGKRINLSKLSGIDIEAIGTLITHSRDKQWNSLNLSGCHIRDAGIETLHQFLQSSKSSVTIKKLWLYKNDLSSSSNSYLVDIVDTCRIEWLDISNNCNSLGQEAELFEKMLSFPSLQRLYISDVNLSSKVVIAIFTLMKENKTNLKRLDMSNTALDYTDEVSDVIAEALQANNKLKHLKMCGNNIIPKCTIKCMVTAIHKNNTLRDLRLPLSNYTDDFKKRIELENEAINGKRKDIKCKTMLTISFE